MKRIVLFVEDDLPAILLAVMVAVLSAEVFARYLLSHSILGATEIANYASVCWLVYLAPSASCAADAISASTRFVCACNRAAGRCLDLAYEHDHGGHVDPAGSACVDMRQPHQLLSAAGDGPVRQVLAIAVLVGMAGMLAHVLLHLVAARCAERSRRLRRRAGEPGGTGRHRTGEGLGIMTIILLLLLMIALIAIGLPIAFSLLITSIVYFTVTPSLDIIVVQRMVTSLASFPLLAVPFFVLAGTIMVRGGIAERLIGFADVLVGHLRGGLAQVNVMNSVLIGGMSGSASADAAIDSKVLVPIMRRKGYSNGFASALTATSSVFSPLLPPSISLVIYGVRADFSIGESLHGRHRCVGRHAGRDDAHRAYPVDPQRLCSVARPRRIGKSGWPFGLPSSLS